MLPAGAGFELNHRKGTDFGKGHRPGMHGLREVLPATSGLLSAAGTERALKCHQQRVGFKVPPAEGGLGRSRRCGTGFRWPAEGDKEREGERREEGGGRGKKGGREGKRGEEGGGRKTRRERGRETGGRERERERERETLATWERLLEPCTQVGVVC